MLRYPCSNQHPKPTPKGSGTVNGWPAFCRFLPFSPCPTSFPKWGIFFEQINSKEVYYLEQTKQLVPVETVESKSEKRLGLRALKAAYSNIIGGLGAMMCMVVFASLHPLPSNPRIPPRRPGRRLMRSSRILTLRFC